MNPEKQHRKLEKLQLKAEECLTREEAQKIIKKADKAHRKLEGLISAANEQGFTPASPCCCLRLFQLPGLGRDQQQRPRPTQSLDCLPTYVRRGLRPDDLDRSEVQRITPNQLVHRHLGVHGLLQFSAPLQCRRGC